MATELVGFTVYVTTDQRKRLKELAIADARTLSNYVARILESHIASNKKT